MYGAQTTKPTYDELVALVERLNARIAELISSPERLEVLGGKSCKTKAEIVQNYLAKTGRILNREPVPPEKDYQNPVSY